MRYYYIAPMVGEPAPLGEEDPVARERIMAGGDQQAYVYMPETHMWHRSQSAAETLCASTDKRGTLPAAELTAEEIYELIALLDRSDGRTRAGQQVRHQLQRQLRRSGEVLTSSEVGLLSSRLPHRVGLSGQVRTLLEARSGPKRWTALYAYPETSATPRSVTRWLRNAQSMRYSSRGNRLIVQYKRRTITSEGSRQKRLLVEAKYVPDTASEASPAAKRGVTDEPTQR